MQLIYALRITNKLLTSKVSMFCCTQAGRTLICAQSVIQTVWLDCAATDREISGNPLRGPLRAKAR
jgi:hypothetical protein